MRKVLILLTSSYPFGEGETFLANEIPYLASAFHEIIVVSNDTERRQVHELPDSARVLRHPYELTAADKALGLVGLMSPMVWREMLWIRSRLGRTPTRRDLATALVSRQKARKFAGVIRRLSREAGQAEVHVYSYWANDMAVAAAVARKKRWVHRAYCRAHGWDVYVERTGYLPFRTLLAENLDHYLFVSEHGRRYFELLLGCSHPSVGVSRLGTEPAFPGPVARLRPFTVVSCSGLIPLKRVELIARALRSVTSEVRWVHVGDGPTRAAVDASCRGLPEGVRVELRGAMPNAGVLALYGDLRPSLFLNVSRSEGLPVSMMEAMSAGIPVMGTDVGGVGELVTHGSNGILLPGDPTPEQVAAALDGFAALPEETHARYAQQAWDTWNTRFHADKNYQAFLEATRE